MSTVLIVGAGVTRAASSSTRRATPPPLDTDFFSIAKSIRKSDTEKVVSCLTSLVGDYSNVLTKSLETSSTYLYIKAIDSKPGSLYHHGFLKLLHLLNFTLARTTNTLPVGPRSLLYRFLLSELKNVDKPDELSIITFNYDLMVERVLDSLAKNGHEDTFFFPGCYRFENLTKTQGINTYPTFHKESFDHQGVSIFKLHGSLNWQSTHTSNSPNPSALLRTNRKLYVMDSPIISPSLSWNRGKRRVYMKPIVVPPVVGKRGMIHNDIVPLWSKASEKLRNADRVVIAGYSCPPLDLEARILISETMRANESKKVYVVDPNPSAASKFLELCGVDHITIYSSLSDWIRDARS